MPLHSISSSIALLIMGISGLIFLISRLTKQSKVSTKRPTTIWLIDTLMVASLLFGLHALIAGRIYTYGKGEPLELFVLNALHAAWYFLISWTISRLIDARFWKIPAISKKGKRIPPRVFFHLANVLIFCISLLMISQRVYHVEIPAELIISSGVLAAVLGFSAKDVLSDMVAGLIISLDRPFRRGDWIELDDGKTLGEVSDISWRVTKVLTWFNTIKEIPNSSVIRQTVNNLSAPHPCYGHWFYMYLPSDVSISLTRRTLIQACLDCEFVLEDPVPVVRLSEMEHRPYKYMIYVHFKNYQTYFKAKDKLLTQINHALAAEKIPVSAKALDIDTYNLTNERVPILEYSNKQLIKKVKVFQFLDDDHCEQLLKELRILNFDEGETILDSGENNDALYILAFGKLKVERRYPDGSVHVIEKMHPGDYFGVMALLASEPSADRYSAMGECQVLEFKQSALEPIFNDHPEMMKEMADFLATQKFQRMAKLSALTHSDRKQRGNRSLRQYGREFLESIQKSFNENE